MELALLQTEEEHVAASRSRLYQLLALAFTFPDEDFYSIVRDGRLAALLAEACTGLPYDLAGAATLELGVPGRSYEEFEADYIRLFDVGAAGPPCPLYGGVYIGDRMKTMEDATRFYSFFDLRLSPQLRELPDHITTELEFLHYLTFREAEALQRGIDPAPLRRAERDFLARHLCKWVPRMQAKLAKQTALPFFTALVGFAAAFFERDRRYVEAVAD